MLPVDAPDKALLVLPLILTARKAYVAWKSLPPDDPAAVSGEAQRVRALVVELGGAAAGRFIEDGNDAAVDEAPPTRRPRDAVVAELREAVEALSRACVAPGTQVMHERTPRSVRLGARMLAAGARRTGLGSQIRKSRPDR